MYNPYAEELSEERRDYMLEKVANWAVCRHLETPLTLFLETFKPLSFIAGNALLFGAIFLIPFLGHRGMAELYKLFEDHKNVDRLLDLVEAKTQQKGS